MAKNSVASKVKNRDLDPEVFLLIENNYRNSSQLIKYDDLEPDVRSKILSGTGTGTYDDSELRTRIINVETNKAQTTALNNYVKKTDKITAQQLDSTLVNTISTTAEALSDKADMSALSGYVKKADKIHETQLDDNLMEKINARYKNNGGSGNGNVSDTAFAELQDRVFEAEVDISSLTAGMSNYRKKSEFIKITDIESSTATKITNARQTDNPISRDDLDSALKSAIAKIENTGNATDVSNRIAEIENSMRGADGYVAYTTGSGLVGKEIVLSEVYPCATNAEVVAAKAALDEDGEPPSFIIDLANNVILEFDSEVGTYAVTKMDEENVDPKSKYGGQILLNSLTSRMFFLPYEGSYIELGIAGAQKSYKTNVSIAASGSYDITLPDTFSSAVLAEDLSIKVSVKDNAVGSRTYGKYINSEGVCTVAFVDRKITLYNDADTTLDFIVLISGRQR